MNESVKEHYEKAAIERNARLKINGINKANVNHMHRLRIISRLLEKVGVLDNGIDIGTGTGVWAEELAKNTKKVVGIDFAEKNILIAKENAVEKKIDDKITYKIGDAQNLNDIEKQFYDIAVQVSVLQHLEDQALAVRRIHEILKINGHLVILVHNKNCIYNRNLIIHTKAGKTPVVNKYNTTSEILHLLKNEGFEIDTVKFCWCFLNDFIFLGIDRPIMKVLMPVRKCLITIVDLLSRLFEGCRFCNSMFREIVVLAVKK